MTTDRKPSTNGHVYVNGAHAPEDAAVAAKPARSTRDLVMPALILLGLAIVLRRLI